MLSGLGKLAMSGGTAGWGDLINAAKNAANQALNAMAKQESVANYNIYLSIEGVKFEVLKTLASTEMNSDEKDKEV